MMRKIIFILVVCLVALSSCQWDGKSGNTADVDVRVARYDRLQYEYVTMNKFLGTAKNEYGLSSGHQAVDRRCIGDR